jgi:GntR family transcriptional regulator, transcriptional repressor for pyruvate dehydrogenase complex
MAANKLNLKALIRAMREDLLEAAPGAFLGLEEDVLRRYDVSRPTLRQAARVLEYEQLLDVKPGPKGGYFVERPSGDEIVRAAALYLRTRGFRFADSLTVSSATAVLMSRLAARSKDAAGREDLRLRREQYRGTDFTVRPVSALMDAEEEVRKSVARLSGNVGLEFFAAVLYRHGSTDRRDAIFEGRPDRVREWQDARVRAVDAILAGDEEIAQLLEGRMQEVARLWIAEDAERQERSRVRPLRTDALARRRPRRRAES